MEGALSRPILPISTLQHTCRQPQIMSLAPSPSPVFNLPSSSSSTSRTNTTTSPSHVSPISPIATQSLAATSPSVTAEQNQSVAPPDPLSAAIDTTEQQLPTASSSSVNSLVELASHVPVTNVHPMQTRLKSEISKPHIILYLHTTLFEIEPTNFTDASKHHKWQQGMAEEFNALINNNTWQIGSV